MTAGPDDLVRAALDRFEAGPREGLGLAVSGGGDSIALLHLLGPQAQARGIACRVATVDHGLRPEATAEAGRVASACARLGLPHETLDWTGWDGRGNLQDAARRARLRLLADWARRHGLGAVALGHTRDDQAETVLMRLARGSGVDGLSSMAAAREAQGVLWLRPLLEARRADLRDWLSARGIGWDEDPSNDDARFLRVRARRALATLEPVGLTPDRLADTAERMALARTALERLAAELSARAVRLRAGAMQIEAASFADAPEETRLRLVAAGLRWIGGADYRPRLSSLRQALEQAETGRWHSLSGVLLAQRRGSLWLCREPARTGPPVRPDALWDGRWRLEPAPDAEEGLSLAALGEAGLSQVLGWRDTGLPRHALLASPALWRGADLVCAPCAGPDRPREAAPTAQIVAEYPYPALPH